MTKSTEDIISYASRLDDMKKHIGLITEESKAIAFNDESFSAFPLYFAASKAMNFDNLEFEPESIAKIIGNKINSDRVNAMLSTTARGDAWVNVIAFDMFVDAVAGNEINPMVITPDYAEDIINGIIVLAGLDGSFALPLKTNVLKFIAACLQYDGWTMPPLPLMTSNIKVLFEDNMESIEEATSLFGKMSITDIVGVREDDIHKMKLSPSMLNYFIRNQEVALHVARFMDKTIFDWTTIVSRR